MNTTKSIDFCLEGLFGVECQAPAAKELVAGAVHLLQRAMVLEEAFDPLAIAVELIQRTMPDMEN